MNKMCNNLNNKFETQNDNRKRKLLTKVKNLKHSINTAVMFNKLERSPPPVDEKYFVSAYPSLIIRVVNSFFLFRATVNLKRIFCK